MAGSHERDRSSAVAGIGVVLATAVLVTTAVPVRQGVTEPSLSAAAAFALLATVGFLTSRHHLLERRVAGAIAVGSGTVAVVLTGYAINQDALGTVTVPGLEWSISLVLLGFGLGLATVGIAVADALGLSTAAVKRRAIRVGEMVFLGVLGLVGMVVATILVATVSGLVVGQPAALERQVITYLGFGLGLGAVSAGYLAYRGHGREFLDVEVPSRRGVGWTVLGLGLLVGALLAISWLLDAAGIETAGHGTASEVARNPELLSVVVPAMFLVVGPLEEVLYRNVIQKSLYETFSRAGAIVVTSVVFAFVHVLAYATARPGQVLASLAVVFFLSLVLGTIYERTANVVVPAVVHGAYNAGLFVYLVL